MKPGSWGTRYDTLEHSVDMDNGPKPQTLPVAPGVTDTSNVSFDWSEDVAENEPQPTNHARFLTKLPPLYAASPTRSQDQQPTVLYPHTESTSRPPNVTVFVASLPNNLEDHDLKRKLLIHFSRFPGVHHIKVVRDQRGCFCAFVQLEASKNVNHFIRKFENSMFFGKPMRCEIARAHRTLLVSYRTPSLYPGLPDQSDTFIDAPSQARFMRLQENPRHIQALLGEHAAQPEPSKNGHPAASVSDPFSGSGLFFKPLLHNQETIWKVSMACGPIESFRKLPIIPNDGDSLPLPVPRQQAGAPHMEPGIWEVKWGNRENATTALQVLSQLPHVSVSWAHQQPKWSAKMIKIFPGIQDSMQTSEQLHVAKHHGATADDFKSVANTTSMLDTALLSRISSTQVTDTRLDGAPLVDQIGGKIISLASSVDRKLEPGNMLAAGVEADNGSSYDRHVTTPLEAPENCILKPPESSSQGIPTSSPNATHLTSPDQPEPDANRALPRTTTPLETDTCVTPSTPALELPDRGCSHSPVTPATPNSSLLFEGGEPPDLSTSIFVGGLGAQYAWSETKLQQLFSPYGIIREVALITQNNPMASTFAFVRFAEQSQRNAAIDQMHGRQVEGSTLRVQPREPARGVAWRRMGQGRFAPPNDAQHPVTSNRRGIPTHFYRPSSKVGQIHRKPGNVLGMNASARGTWRIFKEKNEVSSLVAPPDGFYPPLNEHILSQKETDFRRNDFETNCIGLPTPGFRGHPVQAGPWVHPYPYFAFGYPNFYGGQVVPFPPLPPHPYGSPTQVTSGQRTPIQPTGFVHSYQGLTPIYPPEALTGYLYPMTHGGPENIPETTSIHDPALQLPNSRNQIPSPYPYYYLTPHFDGRYNFIPSIEQQSGIPPQ